MIDGTTLVLYICSDQPVNYHHRPAQKQVDRLTWLMGTEPEWWIRDSRMFLTPNAALGCHSIPM
ncbi:hypothetical protein C8R48DRAFT_690193 [Suillus tomentosus]|nr:hypothetical protein C8R48DRAFT_690193 [Suillus tomentosus]